MHMCIRYHLLADFRVTRRGCETESKKHIGPDYSNQTLESWTSYKPKSWLQTLKATSDHTLFIIIPLRIHRWICSRKSQTSMNTSEFNHQKRWEMTWSRHGSLSKVQGRESLIFQTWLTFSIDFPNTYNDYLLASVIDSFLLWAW